MNKIIDFTSKERENYGNKLSTIIFSIDEIKNIVPKEKMSIRKYTHGVKLLETYIKMTKEADKKADGKGLFEAFKSDEKYKQELIGFKENHKKEFDQLDKCIECSCLKCSHDCNINPCLICSYNSNIVLCNKNFTVLKSDNDEIELEKNNEIYYFKVLAIIFNSNNNKNYILLENKYDPDDKQMFYFIQKTEEDNYEQINSMDEINQIASIYNSIDN